MAIGHILIIYCTICTGLGLKKDLLYNNLGIKEI